MLTLHIYSDVIDPDTHQRILDVNITDIVKNIIRDENLTTNLESSSSIWKVTLPHDCEYSLKIIQLDDLHAELKDGNTPFFTGWVSTTFSYTIDQYGQNAIQITLEDEGTHRLKAPYTKKESKEIKGKFSSIVTGDLGVVQQICNACGITYALTMKQNSTEVKAIADAAESCESLLKSVCKEMGYAYAFNAQGQLYLIPLSTTDQLPDDPEDDPQRTIILSEQLYGSVNFTKRARTYRGSRIKWTELGTKNDVLVYMETYGRSTIYPHCHVSISNGAYFPNTNGAPTYYKANDIKNGLEIFSIGQVTPHVELNPQNCATYTIDNYGADSIEVLVTGTASGYINQLEATANITYINSHNVTYGDGDQISDALHEEDCRWIHDQNSATKYANFIAQYDKYCSAEFSFITGEELDLGQIIYLNENVYTEFGNYMMVTRRTRTLHEYDDTNKEFTGKWTYRAVSMKQFDFNKAILWEENTTTLPTDTYTQEIPDISDVSGIQLTADQSFLQINYRSDTPQILEITPMVTGLIDKTSLTLLVTDEGGNIVPTNPALGVFPRVDEHRNGNNEITSWTFSCRFDQYWTNPPVNHQDESAGVRTTNQMTFSVTGNGITNTIGITFDDQTQYYKFLGRYVSDRDVEQNAPSVPGIFRILRNDYYLCVSRNDPQTPDESYVGNTRYCALNALVRTPPYQWNNMDATNAENAERLLIALESATQNGVALETMSDPNTVSWFNTIITAKAVIDSLFSRYITILNGGAIHSNAYTDAGVYQGPGAGFWLGSNGELKCETADINNANAVDINISGNSSFHGSFDCSIIKTTPEDPSTYITLSPVGADGAQCKRIVDRLLNNSLIPDWATSYQTTGMIPISVVGVSDIAYMKIAYQKNTRSGTTTYYASVTFYNSSGSSLDIRNYSVLNVSVTSGSDSTDHLYSSNLNFGDLTNIPGEYAAQAGSTDGITIRVLTGQSRLWMSLPTANEATALTSGMLFRSVSPVSTGTTGVTGYAVYMKP